MHTVIKGTKTIDEYKQTRDAMEQLATTCFDNHRQAFEDWPHGDIKKVWYEGDALCIEYADGQWWHYNGNGDWW